MNIRYCDIARGCFNECPDGYTSCEACREKERAKENAVYNSRKALHVQVQSATGAGLPSLQLCCYCGKDFTPFLTQHNAPSRACPACNASQKKQDEKRKERARNYKIERAMNHEAHFKMYFTNAVKRHLSFELTIEEFIGIVKQACYYCGSIREGEVNGIDRFDSDKGYLLENCKPCCEECNYMKSSFHPLFLIEKAKILTAGPGVDTSDFFKKWENYYARITPPTYCSYVAGAKKRSIQFELKQEEFRWIQIRPCYLCGFRGPNGIDRKDSKKGYTLENCNPCCYTCNISKLDIDYSKFIEKMFMIASMWSDPSDISLPLPVSKKIHPLKTKRKHWKAPGLYVEVLNSKYTEFLEAHDGTVTRDDLEKLRYNLLAQPYDDAISTVKTFLNTCNVRKKRAKKSTASDTIDLID